MINTLMCLNLPREHVWLDTYPLPACKDVLRLPALKKAVIMDASHNLAKAKVGATSPTWLILPPPPPAFRLAIVV